MGGTASGKRATGVDGWEANTRRRPRGPRARVRARGEIPAPIDSLSRLRQDGESVVSFRRGHVIAPVSDDLRFPHVNRLLIDLANREEVIPIEGNAIVFTVAFCGYGDAVFRDG